MPHLQSTSISHNTDTEGSPNTLPFWPARTLESYAGSGFRIGEKEVLECELSAAGAVRASNSGVSLTRTIDDADSLDSDVILVDDI